MEKEKKNLVILCGSVMLATSSIILFSINEMTCDYTKEVCLTSKICGMSYQASKLEELGYDVDEDRSNNNQVVFYKEGKTYFLIR